MTIGYSVLERDCRARTRAAARGKGGEGHREAEGDRDDQQQRARRHERIGGDADARRDELPRPPASGRAERDPHHDADADDEACVPVHRSPQLAVLEAEAAEHGEVGAPAPHGDDHTVAERQTSEEREEHGDDRGDGCHLAQALDRRRSRGLSHEPVLLFQLVGKVGDVLAGCGGHEGVGEPTVLIGDADCVERVVEPLEREADRVRNRVRIVERREDRASDDRRAGRSLAELELVPDPQAEPIEDARADDHLVRGRREATRDHGRP